MAETPDRHPYHAGYYDRCMRGDAWDNPYPDDTWQRHAWQAGWEQCSVDLERDRINGFTIEVREYDGE